MSVKAGLGLPHWNYLAVDFLYAGLSLQKNGIATLTSPPVRCAGEALIRAELRLNRQTLTLTSAIFNLLKHPPIRQMQNII